jgi:hypothetical protein
MYMQLHCNAYFEKRAFGKKKRTFADDTVLYGVHAHFLIVAAFILR